MQTIPGQRSDVFIFYPQAGAFVGYLIEEFDHDTMARLLATINGGETLISAIELTYGKSLYELENEWRATFNAEPLALPSATAQASEWSTEPGDSTPIPLVDFEPILDGAPEPASTVSPASLPTVTPQIPPLQGEVVDPADDEPDYVVAAIVIGLSIIVGVWLFTSRRKTPKRND
jgi:hypothetical protein